MRLLSCVGRRVPGAGRARIPPILYWVSSVSGLPLVAEATACLTQLHPPALACAGASPLAAPGSCSRLSPITWPPRARAGAFGWSALCCAWPRAGLSPGAAHLAVSVGWYTPSLETREDVGKFLKRAVPASGGRRQRHLEPSPRLQPDLCRALMIPHRRPLRRRSSGGSTPELWWVEWCRRGDLNSHGLVPTTP